MILDWKEYEDKAREAVAEGVVLLENKNNVLPLQPKAKVAVFGRMQNNYYKSGTGSGGMVNVDKVWGIMDALDLEDVTVNETLRQKYLAFEEEVPFNRGVGFGTEPWSQPEMPLDDATVKAAAEESDVAIVIIGRTAGEEQDFTNTPGAYKLADLEVEMLEKVRAAFDKVVLLMNVTAVLDMSEVERIAPDAVMIIWAGGEMGGLGTMDVVMGRVAPSGHLSDTILHDIKDASAGGFFGDLKANCYGEDVYVGYRYYETFNKDAVLYPFGYGLSYTTFDIQAADFSIENDEANVTAVVVNTGSVPGRTVAQLYVSCPQGKLGQPALKLVGFAKTGIIQPGEFEIIDLVTDGYTFASYDDSGVTGYKSAYVLEAGEYHFYLGENVRDLVDAGGFAFDETVLLEQLSQQMAPITPFKRMKPELTADGQFTVGWEDTPLGENVDNKEAREDCPDFIPYHGDLGIKLKDVRDGKASMEDFLAQLSDEDLTAIVRGEGMGSPRVTPGTAAAFGGVSKNLTDMGIPAACCSDGPSGMRLDCGARAFSLPSGTLLACTWNPELNTELYSFQSIEMYKNNVDALLGPGINIHRYPLNGRNFEYFSEDPLLTGVMAASQIEGLQSAGNTGTIKHFCANNQEANRHGIDSIVSERALREIYLKPFEMAVRCGANSVMTTYGAVNGIWTNSRHDLCTTILRDEWEFDGIVMTDWWASIGDVETGTNKTDFARMVRAGNDFYAVCPEAAINSSGDNLMDELEGGTLTRGQLVRCARHICHFLMNTHAMTRLTGEADTVELMNYTSTKKTVDPADVKYVDIHDGTVIDLRDVNTDRGEEFVFGIDVTERGYYEMSFTASSELGELSQINVSFFVQNIPLKNFSFHGTGGEDMTITTNVMAHQRYETVRLYFGGSGLDAKELRFKLIKPVSELKDEDIKAFYDAFLNQ